MQMTSGSMTNLQPDFMASTPANCVVTPTLIQGRLGLNATEVT
jgi:hypothetical protein